MREVQMPLYMYQATYTPEAWAAQLKKPEGRIETVARVMATEISGRFVGAWYAFGENDAVILFEAPNNESMAALALAIGAGGALKASKTTVLMSVTEGVAAMKKAAELSKVYRPPS
jgi:uncharacterized protein with GYD domain